jgi:hypothetical protein
MDRRWDHAAHRRPMGMTSQRACSYAPRSMTLSSPMTSVSQAPNPNSGLDHCAVISPPAVATARMTVVLRESSAGRSGTSAASAGFRRLLAERLSRGQSNGLMLIPVCARQTPERSHSLAAPVVRWSRSNQASFVERQGRSWTSGSRVPPGPLPLGQVPPVGLPGKIVPQANVNLG